MQVSAVVLSRSSVAAQWRRRFLTSPGLALLLAASAVGSASAVEVPGGEPTSWSFAGTLQLGVIASWSSNDLDPDAGSAVRTVGDNPDRIQQTTPCLLLDMQLRAPEGATFYLQTPMEEYGLAVGMILPSAAGEWDFQAYYGFDEDVWQDPYATGIRRQTTARRHYGGGIGLAQIGGTDLSMTYSARMLDVANDRAAVSYPTLARDGLVHRLRLAMPMRLGSGQLRCELAYERADLDGSASASDGLSSSVAWILPWRQYRLILGGEVGHVWHRQRHPLFGKTREDLRLGASAMVTYQHLFGIEGAQVGAMMAWRRDQSNCDFYDAQTYHLGVLVGYGF